MTKKTLVCALILVWPAAWCLADFTETGPFVGDLSENFDSFGGGGGGFLTLDIFEGAVTLNNLTDGGAIKLEFGSTLIVGGRSDTVRPRSRPTFMGQIGVMEWVFNRPVSRFGGYFENNSFEDHVNFDFFDANNNLIQSVEATNFWASDTWTWNGWQSNRPIYRAVSAGNNETLLNGFVWYEDMEIEFAAIPEPAGMALLPLVAWGIAGIRRRN